MDKKKSIIIGVIVVVIVALVFVVMGMSSNVPKVSLDTLMTIDGNEYSVNEFKKYMFIKKEASGDIAAELKPEEIESLVNEFSAQKLYVASANKKGIKVSAEEITHFKEDYAKKAETFGAYAISESDYLKYAEDEYKEEELSNKFAEYYELPEKYYTDLLENYSGDQKTYSFRMMSFYYDEETSGDVHEHVHEDELENISGDDVSGDVVPEVSGDVSGDKEEEKEDRSRATILATAEDVLSQVRSGSGDFGALAKEHSSMRFTFNGSQYTLINGDVEYATTAVLESKIGNVDAYNAMLKLKAGETTDIIEDEENNVFYLVKVESIEDGFVGSGDKELREILLMQYQEDVMLTGITYDFNTSALLRLYYN